MSTTRITLNSINEHQNQRGGNTVSIEDQIRIQGVQRRQRNSTTLKFKERANRNLRKIANNSQMATNPKKLDLIVDGGAQEILSPHMRSSNQTFGMVSPKLFRESHIAENDQDISIAHLYDGRLNEVSPLILTPKIYPVLQNTELSEDTTGIPSRRSDQKVV